jgi:hypothetical protein
MSETQILKHRGAETVTRTDLARMAAMTPAGTSTFKPVPHFELVETMSNLLARRGATIVKEELAVSANRQQIFGVFNFENGIHLPGIGRAMGFHAANDKTLAIQIVAGVRIFICDNLALSGSAIVLKRKHTRALDLASQINLGLDRFEEGREIFEQSIERLQIRAITDGKAKESIFDLVYSGVVGSSLFSDISRNYFQAEKLGLEDCAPRTAWGLHNSCTRAVKALSPASQYRTTEDLGKYFGLGTVIDAEAVEVAA